MTTLNEVGFGVFPCRLSAGVALFSKLRARRRDVLRRHARLLEATKPKVDSPRLWRITAALWDVPTFVSVFGLLFVVGDLFQNLGVWAIEILVGIFYVFGLLVTWGETREWGYVYFLSWKAKKATARWRPYWFFKFRYQVSRYIRHIGFRSGRDLFVRQYVRRFAEAAGESIQPADVPGLREIMLTVRQSGFELQVLKSDEAASKEITRDVRVLEDYLSASQAPAEAFLRYAISMYINLKREDRELVRLASKRGLWTRIGDDPIASRILAAAVAGATVAAVTAVLSYLFR